jgi:leucyl aminopeptidase
MTNQTDHKGYISIHRKLEDNYLWLAEPFTKGQAWIDLLLIANHKDNSFFLRGIKIDVKRGQIAWSEERLASRWKWSRGKLRNFLKLLEIEQQIIQHRSNKINIIEIINYDFYQKQDNKLNNKKTTKRQQIEQQKDINNNDNNVNNDNNDNKSIPPSIDSIRDYCNERMNNIDPQRFFDFYQSKGWLVGKSKMKDWKAALRNWENSNRQELKPIKKSVFDIE